MHLILKVRFYTDNFSFLPGLDPSRTVYIRSEGGRDSATETERADKKTEVKIGGTAHTKWVVHTKKTTVLSTVLSYNNLHVS